MRIIAGTLRGRRIPTRSSQGIRPTSERVREAIFSTLHSVLDSGGGCLEGASVLDLYAGTGALGLEALSRGAASCCFVEQQGRLAKELRGLIGDFALENSASVVQEKVENLIERPEMLGRDDKAFDLVFADPPYGSGKLEQLVLDLTKIGLIGQHSIVVFEDDSPLDTSIWESAEGELRPAIIKDKKYGGTVVSLVRLEARVKMGEA